MAYAFEIGDELPDPPTRAEVEADIADWKLRLDKITSCIQDWMRDGQEFRCDPIEYRMSERKMEFVGIHEDMVLPGLLITRMSTTTDMDGNEHAQQVLGKILPDARWVIGTRGQIRFWTPGRVYTIADLGEPGRAEWHFTNADDLSLPLFTRPVLLQMLDGLR